MKVFIVFIMLVLSWSVPGAQVLPTANTLVPAHQSLFSYGINPGYYSGAWPDAELARIAVAAGVHSSRLSLPDDFLETNGIQARSKEFAYYTGQLKLKDLTVFIGSPSKKHQETTIYPGCNQSSLAFRGIYKPSWIIDAAGTWRINPENTLAVYINSVYAVYGKYIAYWEVWNEPDFTGNWAIASLDNVSGSWWHNAPLPQDLPNLRCPVYLYIRMMRVTYEVVKHLNPEQLVTTGGIGYESFLEQILNFTDNPDHGKVSAAFPLKGGAYFDVLSFHDYPFYYLSSWNNLLGGKEYKRHSDAAADEFAQKTASYAGILARHGYNGKIFPKKYLICTEINIPAKTYPGNDAIGSEVAQRNFTIKSLVAAQKVRLNQLYYFVLGRSSDENASTDPYQLMGLYYNLGKAVPGKERLTAQGTAFKTTSQLLYGLSYDAALTAALKLNAETGGAAFSRRNEVVFVLWAKTSKDLCECNTSIYPAGILSKYKTVYRHEWNFSITRKAIYDPAGTVKLTTSPVFYTTK